MTGQEGRRCDIPEQGEESARANAGLLQIAGRLARLGGFRDGGAEVMNRPRHRLLRTMLRDPGIVVPARAVAVLAGKYLVGARGTRIVRVTFCPAVVLKEESTA